MVSKEIGIRGYLGEEMVRIWLENMEYPQNKGYYVINQIMPDEVPKRGGPYLDFAVIKDNEVVAIYEVKTQDYSSWLKVNKSAEYLWCQKGKKITCVAQDGKQYKTQSRTKTYLVLFVAPSKFCVGDVELPIGKIPNESILFINDIVNELKRAKIDYKKQIRDDFENDFKKELENNWINPNTKSTSTKNRTALEEKGKIARL